MYYSTVIKVSCLSVFLLLAAIGIKAQCVEIINLPDTVITCKNTQVSFNPTVVSPGLLFPTDTIWTPGTGLTDSTIINPIATVGTTSTSYKLTIQALTPFNFVNNGDFSAGNTGFTSGYILGTGGAWGQLSNEGTFAVTTNPASVHTNFASFGDHTTGTGQMMVVNGAATANVSVWCQTITVQPNTTYDFSAWSATCVISNPAVLQFAINGVLLGAPHNLPGVTGVWTQFHATWFSGTNTSATICITNQNTMPSGNDFAIDDIEFREFCTVEDSVYIQVVNLEPAIQHTIHLGCEMDSIRFEAVNNGDTADQYIWDFGDGNGSILQNPEHVYAVQGVYNVKLVTRKYGCEDSATITVNTLHPMSIDFTMSDDSICIGQDIQFTSTASAASAISYYWDFGDNRQSTNPAPIHTYTQPGIYTVRHVIHDQIPCYDTMYKTVVVEVSPSTSLTVSDTVICEGETIRFDGSFSSSLTEVLWDFGDGYPMHDVYSLSHAYDRSGFYTVMMTAKYPLCPDAVITRNILVHPIPKVDIGADMSLCPYNTAPILLRNHQGGQTDAYLWNNGATGYEIQVRHPGIYALTVTNSDGCSAADSMEVVKDCYIDIPNVFTPDGDGHNDYFLPRQLLSKGLSKFHMQIFNRWGQLVFETNRLDGRGWDGKFNGKEQPNGVYVYLIEVEIGSLLRQEKYQGNVTLLR